MKTVFIIAVIVASFGIYALAEHKPVPELEAVMKAASTLEHFVTKLEADFEADIIKNDAAALDLILKQVIANKTDIAVLRARLVADIESEKLQHFWERVMANWIDVEYRNFEQLLNEVAFEILGHKAGIIKFTKGVNVNTLDTVLQLTEIKFSNFQSELQQADKLIKAAFDSIHNGSKLEPNAKLQVNKHLSNVISISKTAKDELSKEYYPQVEKLRYENKQMNRIQKMKIERFIDGLYFVVQFVTEYQQTFQKLVAYF